MVTNPSLQSPPAPASPPWVSTWQPAQSGWEKAVESGGNLISSPAFLPGYIGLNRAAMPRRGDSNALAGGMKGAVNGLTYQYLMKQGVKLDRHLKQTFPQYGEWANQHPTLSGILTFGWVFPLALAGAELVSDNPLTSRLFNKLGVKGTKAIKATHAGRVAVGGWRKVARLLRHPTVIVGSLVAFVALGLGMLVKGYRDNKRFKQSYQKMRTVFPDRQQVAPDALRYAVMQVLSNPQLNPYLNPKAAPVGLPSSLQA